MSQSGEKELILGNKQLISLFFVVIALCGVFFAMGYMVRGSSLKGTVAAAAVPDSGPASPSQSDTVKRQQPEPPSPDAAQPTDQPPAGGDASQASAAPTETRPAQDAPPPAAQGSAPPASDDKAVASVESGASYVQVGALARADADATVRTLREQHLPALVAASSKEGLYRVLVGPFHRTIDVADAKAKLKDLGFSNTIVQKQ